MSEYPNNDWPAGRVQTSRFLQLPLEIRLMILRYLLHSNSNLDTKRKTLSHRPRWINGYQRSNFANLPCHCSACIIRSAGKTVNDALFDRTKNFEFQPQALRVCRQLLSEGREVLYSKKTIEVSYIRSNRPRTEEYTDAYVIGGHTLGRALEVYPALKTIKDWSIVVYLDLIPNLVITSSISKREMAASTRVKQDVDALRQIDGLTNLKLTMHILATTYGDQAISRYLKRSLHHFQFVTAKGCSVSITPSSAFGSFSRHLRKAVIEQTTTPSTSQILDDCVEYLQRLASMTGRTNLFLAEDRTLVQEIGKDTPAQLPTWNNFNEAIDSLRKLIHMEQKDRSLQLQTRGLAWCGRINKYLEDSIHTLDVELDRISTSRVTRSMAIRYGDIEAIREAQKNLEKQLVKLTELKTGLAELTDMIASIRFVKGLKFRLRMVTISPVRWCLHADHPHIEIPEGLTSCTEIIEDHQGCLITSCTP